MNTLHQAVSGEPIAARSRPERQLLRKQRPSFRWSDLWKAPLHDLPIRDEILYQFLPLSPDMDVLEIGPGSGFTAFRLARQVRKLTLVDVAEPTVAELQRQLRELSNVQFFCADLSHPALAERLRQEFDTVFGLDVFEYVVNPGVCLRNLAEVLRPGGTLLLTYPNVPPPVGDGVTYFPRLAELERLLEKAGFRDWIVFAIRLRPFAAGTYGLLHETPLALYRRFRSGSSGTRPQTYEATWAFQNRERMLPFKVLLHVWWAVLEGAIRLGGNPFQAEPATDGILGRQLVIRAWR